MILGNVLLVVLLIMRIIVLYNMKDLLAYFNSSRATGRVYVPCHRSAAVYVSLGVVGLYRNLCGEVERGIISSLGGDVTLTRAGRVAGLNQTGRHYCQL